MTVGVRRRWWTSAEVAKRFIPLWRPVTSCRPTHTCLVSIGAHRSPPFAEYFGPVLRILAVDGQLSLQCKRCSAAADGRPFVRVDSSPVLFSCLRSFTGYDPYSKRSCWASTGSSWSFLHLRWRFQEIRSCSRLLECPAAMLDSVTGLSPTVSSRVLLFSPTHKRAPFYVRSSNPRAWDELCYWPPSYTGTLRRPSRSSRSSISRYSFLFFCGSGCS